MGNDDVVDSVELKPYQQHLSDSNGFATFLISNTTTLAKNNGTVDLTVSLNGSYMSILNWEIKSQTKPQYPVKTLKILIRNLPKRVRFPQELRPQITVT